MSKVWEWIKKHVTIRNFLLCGIGFLFTLFISAMLSSHVESIVIDFTGIEDDKPELLKFIGWGISVCIATLGVVGFFRRTQSLVEQDKLPESAIFILLLFIALFAMLWLMISVMLYSNIEEIFRDYTGYENSEDKPEIIKLIGLGISGIIATLGVIGLLQRAAAQDKQNKLTEKGQNHERFKTAVEHIGDKNSDSVRIASFYEFSNMTKIEPTMRKTIFNILCAHLRQITDNTSDEYDITKSEIIKPTVEVHDLLDVLFSPRDKDGFIFDGLTANLRGVNIQGASLQNVYLKNAKLQLAKLQQIKLEHAELQNARMWRAELQKANLQSANLQSAYLRHADLQEANLQEANLQRVNLHGADLRGADLRKAYMANAKLHEAKINEKTEMPDGWESIVEKDENGKTGVLLVDDEYEK